MKRARGDDTRVEPATRPKRRPKASEACVACRKAKTRCEPAADPARGGCHRCTVLFLPCSFLDGSSSSASPGSSVGAALHSTHPGPRVVNGPQPTLTQPLNISPFDATGITPEDLLSITPANAESAHWSTAPMSAMHELIARPSGASLHRDNFPLQAQGILDVEQIVYLQDIFETHYTPWLNLPRTLPSPTLPPSLDDFLTLARCAVTARHLPPTSFAIVLPHLQKLVEHSLLVHMFNASKFASAENVQALLILALWSPAVGHLPPDVQDGGRIAMTAVKMAIAIRMDYSMKELVAFRQRAKAEKLTMTPDYEEEHKQLIYNTQLWSCVCNTEWSLCLGTGHTPTSKPVEGMYDTLNPRVFLGTASVEDIRGFRLYLTARLLESTNRGLQIKLKDLKSFTTEMEGIFSVFNGTRNCLLPLQATFPHERMHLDVVLMMAYWKILLTLFHGLTQIRVFMELSEPNKPWLLALEESQVPIATRWGIMSTNAAQSVLVTFLDIIERCQASFTPDLTQPNSLGTQIRFSPPLATAPDSLFAVVLFAASAMLIVRTTTVQFRRKRSITWFTTGVLLTKLADTLDSIAISNEHAPRRAAAVIRELTRVWNEKITADLPVDHNWPRLPRDITVHPLLNGSAPEPQAGANQVPSGGVPLQPDAVPDAWPHDGQGPTSSGLGISLSLNEFGMAPSNIPYDFTEAAGTAGTAMAMGDDDEFWTSFMGNLGGSGDFTGF